MKLVDCTSLAEAKHLNKPYPTTAEQLIQAEEVPSLPMSSSVEDWARCFALIWWKLSILYNELTTLLEDILEDWDRNREIIQKISRQVKYIQSSLISSAAAKSNRYIASFKDEFLDTSNIDLSQTSAIIDTDIGVAYCGVPIDNPKVSIDPTVKLTFNRIDIRSRVNVGELDDILSDTGLTVNILCEKGGELTAELVVDLREQINAGAVSIKIDQTADPSSLGVMLYYTTDMKAWIPGPINAFKSDKFYWNLENATIRGVKFSIVMRQPDTSNQFKLRLSDLSIWSRPISEGVIVTHPIQLTSFDSPVNFGEVRLQYCAEIPEGASVTGYIRPGVYDASKKTITWSDWIVVGNGSNVRVLEFEKRAIKSKAQQFPISNELRYIPTNLALSKKKDLILLRGLYNGLPLLYTQHAPWVLERSVFRAYVFYNRSEPLIVNTGPYSVWIDGRKKNVFELAPGIYRVEIPTAAFQTFDDIGAVVSFDPLTKTFTDKDGKTLVDNQFPYNPRLSFTGLEYDSSFNPQDYQIPYPPRSQILLFSFYCKEAPLEETYKDWEKFTLVEYNSNLVPVFKDGGAAEECLVLYSEWVTTQKGAPVDIQISIPQPGLF